MKNQQDIRKGSGFSLVEVVISLGVISVGLLSIVALSSDSLQKIGNMVDRDLAMRLRSTIHRELQNPERFDYFYQAIRSDTPIYAYCYGGEVNDGEPQLRSSASVNFYSAKHHANNVRASDDPLFISEIEPIPNVGRVVVTLFDIDTGDEILTASLPDNFSDYSESQIAAVVSVFFSDSRRVINGDYDFDGFPVSTFNIVIKP